MRPVRARTCKLCGGPLTNVTNRRIYCSEFCRTRSTTRREFFPCPVAGCHNACRRSSLVTCTACWQSVPESLRDSVVTAHHIFRAAGVSNLEQATEALDEAKEEVIQAATEARLVHAGFTNQEYFLKQGKRRRSRERLGLAAA